MRNYTPTINLFRQHNINDWLAMTRSPRCGFPEKGVLTDAHDLFWLGGCTGLPSDPSELAKVIGCTKKNALAMLDHTTGYEIIDGLIYWQTLERAHVRAKSLQEKARSAGLASAKVRAEKNANEQP